MRKSRHFFTMLAVLALCSCAAAKVDTVWDTHHDFAELRTFGWAPKVPEAGPELPYDVIDSALRMAVEAEMRAAGFTLSSSNPSFLLTYYVGVEEVARITDRAYYGPGWGAYWGFGWYGPAGVNVSQYDPGTITIDLLSPDPAVGMIWRGIATGRVDTTMSAQQVESAVRTAVREILADFPPQLPEG